MAEDKVTNLYNAFVKNGYAMEPEAQFRENLKDPKKRKAAYDALVADSYNMEPFADFESNIGFGAPTPALAPTSPTPQQQAQPAATAAPTSVPASTTAEEQEQALAPVQSQPEQPAWQPSEQEKIRMSYQMHTMLNDFKQKSKARIEQVQRMTEPLTPEGRKKLKAAKFQAQLAGTPTKVMGLTPPKSAPASDAEQEEATEGAAQQQPVQSGQSPVPYGVKYIDGKAVTQWLLPDGRLTTDYLEADQAEYGARTARLRHQFENRMKQNGLDPAKPEDVEMQAQFDAQAPAYSVVADLWREAEEKHKADKERNANKHWNSYASMGGGREMRVVTTSMNRHADNISHMTRFDLEKMMDNAWARVGSQVTANCYNRLRQQYPGASDEELQAAASQMARSLSDNAVYQYAVQQNTPKSTLEYFGRTVADMNVINSISKGLARSQAGTSGDLPAYEVAMGEYGKNHRIAQVAGTVAGMAVDPVTWVSGGVGSVAGKGAISLGGRYVASRAATSMSTQVGSRLFSSSLTGRIITGAAAGGGNFATYEMLKEGESQFLHGGHVNAETGEVEGYSAGAILKAGGHGLVLGSVTGTLSPMIGNVADKYAKAATSTAGKAGVRFGEVAVSTVAEGTVFSIPQWISGEGDAFDVWTDNMAMMLGFKAQHGIKSAPRMIASLRPVKPTNGRPLTQAERNHNRMDFEERLRRNLDASPGDLSFTADEREELRRTGYGELADLFSRDRVQEAQNPNINSAEGAIELRTERVEAETIHSRPEFDGYSAMEELMQDGRVSQAARAKAYYILTGRMLPMGSVTGYTKTTADDGRVTINSTTADGEIVTSRTFKNEQEAKQETDNIMRQAELNTIDVGERYKEAVADDMVLDAAISEVSPGADPATIKKIYRAVKAGNKDVTESQVQLVEFLDDAIARNSDMADKYRPEAIRAELMEETGIDVDAVLRKMPGKRTEAEQAAVKSYLERLFPEEARQQNAEPTPEQAEAQNRYEQGRLLYGRFEEGDPTVQADVDAIALRMQEAYQAVEDAFRAEAEYYMFHVNENPWALVNDPELTAEQQDAVLYYINAKAALDGVMDASNEAADRKRAEVEQSVGKRTHKDKDGKDDGMIISAETKMGKQVYIVMGDVVMFPDNKGVDRQNSSSQIWVLNPESGEYEPSAPEFIERVIETVSAQEELDTALSVIEQEQMSVFGENAIAPEEPAEGEAPIDQSADVSPEPAPETASTEEYDRGYEQGLEEAAKADDAWIANLIKIYSQNTPESMPKTMKGRLDAFLYEQQRRAQSVPETPENVPNPTENTASDAEIAPETVSSVENGQQTALSRIPTNEQGEPRFEAVDKDTAWDGLVEAVGGEADAADIAMAQVQQASTDLEALKKKPPTLKAPKLKGSPMAMAQAKREAAEQYQRDLAQYNQQIADTEARLTAWNGIVGVYTSRNAELRRQQEEERRQRDAIAHDEAVARFEEEQRIKAEKQAEQERIGVHAVNPKIRERWESAPKVEGNEDALTLPDGSTISGRYILTEAGAASPSHDVNNAYAPTEGFPIDENGQSVNDRDYQRDKDAQQKVEGMAGNYDNRALQDPVIVSKDGVVLSGNNRTMSGDLAARQGTDRAYNDYLAQFGHKKYGFTPEQVASMKNPRVVFVPDEALPYDATTFARFNAQEKKSQGKPEAAVKLGKIVPDNVFTSIVNDISRYDRLSDYYADEKAIAHALGALMQAGVINDMQMPEMRTGTALSAAGKELIENTLIGKVFQTSPDAVRQIISMPTLRQSIVMGLNEIANNRTLARNGYDISEELAKAVDLVTRAKAAMQDVYTDGMPVSPFGRMQGLFDDEFGDSRVTDATALLLADILNSGKPSDLRKLLTSYNNEAAQASGGQLDMFSGSIPSKEEILTNVNKHFRNATPKEQQALVEAAIAERKRRAEAEAERRGRGQESEQTQNDVERSAEPQQPVASTREELTPEEQALAARVEISENDWEEGDGDKPTYKREIIVDGTHKVTQVDAPNEDGHYTGSYFEFDGKRFGYIAEITQYIDGHPSAELKVDGGMQSEPTEAQKAAGNYKMEHRKVDGYNVSIENVKGSVRRGKSAGGMEWQTTMQNDYGYIRGTQGVDGDHIDVFLSDTPEEGDVFVVDQVNEDGSFDEHKVMYGFPSEEAAREAYLSNYEPGWTGLGAITHVSKDEFKKWIDSSKRKTKPFADYKSVRDITYNVDQTPTNVNEEGMIVDGEGKPLTLYHGTPNDVEFADLEPGHTKAGEDEGARYNGDGISFTPNRDVAVDYATDNNGEGKVFEVNVTLKKPYYTLGVANFTPEEAAEFTASLQAKGHDGIINYQSKAMREGGALPTEVIVFDIKSATPATAVCPVCGKAGIPNYHSHDVVCPQCNSDLSVFRQIDQLSVNEKQELSDKFVGEDNQGNPIDHVGNLIVEDVMSIDDISDDDFINPARTVGLPKLPGVVSDAIGSNDKRVIIKRNIFGKNHKNHKELTPAESREILRTALYTPSLYGQNQKQTRPYNWILIHLADKNTCVLLEVDNTKENCEIVNWHYLREETLKQKERQAEREGGRILTLSEGNVAGNTSQGLSSDGKVNTLSSDKQTDSAESSQSALSSSPQHSTDKSGSAFGSLDNSKPYTITPAVYVGKSRGGKPGKETPMHRVTFNRPLTTDQERAIKAFANEAVGEKKGRFSTKRGWADREAADGSWLFRTEEDARKAGEMIGNEEAVADAQPMTAEELREAVAHATPAEKKPAKPKKSPINRVSLEDVMTDLSTKGETKLSDHAEPVKAEPEAQHEISQSAISASPQHSSDKSGSAFGSHEISDDEMQSLANELRELLGIGEDEGDADIKFRDPGELAPQERQKTQSAGIRLAMGLIERGTTSFPDYATKMVGLLGDKIRPWLKSFYEGARWTPGYEKYDFTPTEQVAFFDVQNFDKKQADPIAQAAMIVEERKAATASEQAQKELIETRNKNRRKNDKQREADTAALAEKAEAVAGEAESIAETSADAGELNRASELIDQTLDEVNDQLAVLGYYEAVEDDSKFHESYGYMLTAEKKAVADATKLAKQLVNDLGIDIKVTSATTPLGRKSVKKGTAVRANIAPAGGDVIVNLPLNEGRILAIYIGLEPVAEKGSRRQGDNLAVERILYRVENPNGKGMERYGHNMYAPVESTYADFLRMVKEITCDYLPKEKSVDELWQEWSDMAERGESPYTITPEVEAQLAEERKVDVTHNGDEVGDEVMWDHYGNGNWEKVKIEDFDTDGGPIFEAVKGVMSEKGDWSRVKPADGIFGEAKRVARAAQEKKRSSRKKDVTLKSEQPVGDLFGGLFDNTQNLSNHEETEMGTRPGEAGGQRQQFKQDTQVGGDEPRRETERPAGEAGSGSTGMDSDADRAGSRGLHDVATQPALERLPEKERKNVHNNHVERGTEVAPKSESARIKANIAAIETMKKLEASGEAPTAADMKKLRAFSGWGGLGKAFSDWDTSRQLRQLLGDKLYDEGAEMSRNSAYFTPAYIVDAMWDIARAMGFKGGRVLEGSAGIGNVLGLMPQDLSERSYIRAVEKDPTTGKILSLLYPDAVVDIDGFEKVKIETGTYDLVITNVPFVPGLKVADTSGDGDISKEFKTSIHDFCIAKNVRKLRDGGVGVFITTAGSMDGTGRLHKWLSNRENADIVGMFRMHNETFGGTNATSDIIVVRKRVNGVKSPNAIDCSLTTGVRTAEYDTGEKKKVKNVGEVPIIKTLSMSYNRYYVEHPEYMAGEMHFGFEKGDTSFRPESKGLYPIKEKDQSQLLSQWVEDMKQKLADTSEEPAPTVMNHRDEYVPTYDKVGNEVKTGTVVVDSQGRICVNYDGTARPLMSKLDNKNPKSADERIAQFNKNKVKGRSRVQVVQDYNAIKKALNDLLEYQKTSDSDEGLQPKLKALNRAFDSFVATYGHLHGNNGLAWLKNDVDYPSVIALETYREEGLEHKKVFGKADIFSRRVVVRPEQPKATNVRDGVTLSIRQTGSLDTRYIADQLGMSEADVRREVIEAGLGYENPLTHSMEAAHEYLSGNVREKMQQAEVNNEDGRYTPNITALRKVVPHNIPSHFIEFSIGSSWLRPELFEQYVKERTGASVKLTYAGGMWAMDKPKWTGEQDKSFGIRSEICDKIITGTELIEAAMTNRTIRVSKQQKDGPTISDPKATSACAAKVDEIRDDFKSWLRSRMESAPELAKEIEETYNNIFNNSAPMTIPDEYIPEYFDGAARVIGGKPIKMRKHQSKAIVRGTMQSLMLAHEVGTGKTFTLITTAMEMRRLGTAKKPMIVVQNATLGQFVASAKALYPDARILSLEDKDRNAEGRKDFYAKIRYNDWDMVVIPQSVLERIPDHPDRERRFIEESIQEKMDVIEAMSKDREAGRAVAALKKDVENLRDQLNKLSDTETAEGEVTERVMVTSGSKPKKDGKRAAIAKENAKTRAEEMLNRATDDTLNFDDLGVDAILVDEAHEYKHLGFATAMQRGVKGVDPSYSKKCQGLYLKVKAVQEKSGGRNVIFATGTPISNTAAEVWTFMRYLLPREVMEGHNIWHFDDFVRNFGSIQQMLEFTTQGTYKENNRFAGYSNLPELARIWAGITDTVLTAEAGEVKSQIPELEGGQPTDLYLPQTNGLRAVLKFVRAQLKAYDEMSGQEKKENSHIPLVMYGIAKAAAIDARLVMANAPDDPHSKTNEAVRQTLRSLEDSKAYNGTVAIFADNYQRKNKGTGAVEFNLFDDIRTKLIAQGVPAEQVVIMRDGMTDKAKEKIFAKVNAGEIRVILGTTQRLGVGVNIQERLHMLMHIDAPNRPMDYWQRMGRLLRQGNMHKEMGIPVRVIRFGVEDSLDVTAYQRLKTKGAIADAIMHSKDLLANNLENRILEEEGDEFGNITAELSGSQYAMLQNQTEKELRKLQAKQDQHRQHQMYIHRAEPRLREQIEKFGNDIMRSNEILALLENNPTTITINGKTYQSREDMQKVFEAHNKAMAAKKQSVQQDEPITSTLTFDIGNVHFTLTTHVSQIAGYGGQGPLSFDVDVQHDVVSHDIDYKRSFGDIPLKRIINELVDSVTSGKEERSNREAWVNAKERNETDLAALLKDKGKPFEHGERIKELEQKLEEYTIAMQEELKEKEAKYAEMDANIEDATDITFTSEDDGDSEDTPTNGDGNKYREDDDIDYSTLSDSNPMAMEARISELSKKVHTPVRIIRSLEELNEITSHRKRNAKGWWSAKDNEVVIVLPNNVNVADVDNTFVHEVAGHKGLRAFIGEERFNEFLGEVYNHASNPIRKVIDKKTDDMVNAEADRRRVRKAQARERAGEDVNSSYYADMAEARVEAEAKREEFRKEATEEYMSELGGRIGSEGFEKMSRDELTLWGKIKAKVQSFLDKFLRGLKIAKSIRLNDKDLSYILYKSWKNLRDKQGKGGVFAEAEDVVMRRRTGYDADDVTRFRDPGLGLEETITKMKAEALQANTDNLQAKRDAMRAIGGNLNHLRQAMARQREYDITTVKSVADLARILMDANLLDDLSKYETKRILGAINNVVGKQDVSRYVQKVMDIMVDNQLRMGANTLGRLLSIRGSHVDARGIEVQGELDPDGQRIAQVVRKATSLPKDNIDIRIAEAINRMSSTDQAIADDATIEYAGLQIARQYVEDITESKAEEKALRDSIKQAKEDKDAGQMTEDAYRQYVASTEDAIRQNKIERAEAFHSLVEQVGGVLNESVERAKAWREAEKQRVEEIHHNANSDMEGRPTDEHHKDDRTQKLANNSGVRFLLAPLATFDQMLRMFGKKNTRGEGYLWNRYMRGWVSATEKEYTGYRDALKVLDAKVSEIYGKDMKWGDLFSIDRKLPKASVRFFDGGEMKDHELTQGNLLYIYMADKMSDGRMKLRRMGITEEDIEDIKNFLDPKFIQLADWMQEEFLVDKRNEYNEVHKRMFGASMAAIENYFPLKILANARLENVDVADDTTDTALPATSTGSIIKRRRNNLALDVTGANAFSVILDHLQQMERWAAFAEFNRDLNTLLSYKRFRNQVMNMSSVYGGGKTLWNNVRNVCRMAAGAYRPPIAALDKSAVNIAKGVTAAKVSFRVFTALKQFLSMPAYISDSNPMYLAANIANPIGAWRWSMKNLPLFEKRWSSRMAGDPRLLKSDMDWKMWRSRIVEIASRVGMSPNAFVDALTVAIGSHSMYQTKLAKYKRQGYAHDVAEARAKQDATILFNQTQQSSEGAFLSTMQVDRSWLSVLFTVFRNSSMSYTRQLYDSIRNLGHRFTPGYKGLSEEFMAKQMRRDGIDPDKADRNAKQEYRRGIIRDLVRVGVFGYVLQLAWNLGAYLPYLILGEDDEEKDKMWQDVWNHSMFGSIEGLTGGDVISAAGNMWVSGEGNPQYLTKDMPLASDVLSILKKMDKDQVSAMNDVINLLVQSTVGVNPQSLTDAVVAVMDYCGDDAETSRECALLMARVLNCPQSQLDKIYFDELDASGEEASQMTPSEIAERYARYKVRRGAPLTGWAYGNEQREKLMDKYRDRSNTLAKEWLTRETDKQASQNMAQWLEEFEATKDRVKEIRKVKSRDEDRYDELLNELEITPEYDRYEIIKGYKRDVDALTKEWLNATTPAQRDSCAQAIIRLKSDMVRELINTQQ